MNLTFNNLSISHVASCVPSEIIDVNNFINIFGEKEVKKIISNTGISSVRIAGDSVTSSDLCESAFRNIIESGNIDAGEIEAIIFVSQTGDFRLPQTSNILQQKLNLSKETICIDIPLGCSGYVYGLFQSAMLILAGCKKVLLLAGDTNSKIINPMDKSLAMIFGDAGTATIIEKGDQTFSFTLRSDGSGKENLILKSSGFRDSFLNQDKLINSSQCQHIQSNKYLFMDGLAIMNFAMSEVPDIINYSIDKAGWSFDELTFIAFHQANEFILKYLKRKIKLKDSQVPISVNGYGNTGPASIPLMLCDKLHSHSIYSNLDKVILCGFGVGYSWGTASVNISKTKFYKPVIYGDVKS